MPEQQQILRAMVDAQVWPDGVEPWCRENLSAYQPLMEALTGHEIEGAE